MKKEKCIILPNDAGGFIAEELRERLNQGLTVTIAFGGGSMMPLIDGRGDSVELEAVTGDLACGEVCLFVYQGHFVVHRLIRKDGDNLVFRGDSCRREECVGRDAVMARLVAVVHRDGRVERCDSLEWKLKSRCVSFRRSLINSPFKLFGRSQRRWQRWVYLAFLLVLMWAPVGVLGVPLNNFVFGIRADHLLHASVYIPFVFFFMDIGCRLSRRLVLHMLLGLLCAVTTETVQAFLPYRGFDINDLVANFMGVILGWILVLVYKNKQLKIK